MTGILSLIFFLKVIITKKYVAVAYFLYIYCLSSLLSFISPASREDTTQLPISTTDTGEYRAYNR